MPHPHQLQGGPAPALFTASSRAQRVRTGESGAAGKTDGSVSHIGNVWVIRPPLGVLKVSSLKRGLC